MSSRSLRPHRGGIQQSSRPSSSRQVRRRARRKKPRQMPANRGSMKTITCKAPARLTESSRKPHRRPKSYCLLMRRLGTDNLLSILIQCRNRSSRVIEFCTSEVWELADRPNVVNITRWMDLFVLVALRKTSILSASSDS